MMLQMEELQQWGIMTDWRYSYFTMMPAYQAMVLRKFAEFLRKGIVFRGDRPVYWSVQKQRVLGEEEMKDESEIIDCAIMKLPFKAFTDKSKQIKELYPEAKMLVFYPEPW
jgi:isoleucyl-tRNA synthetase